MGRGCEGDVEQESKGSCGRDSRGSEGKRGVGKKKQLREIRGGEGVEVPRNDIRESRESDGK